ncbi:MAG: response regulator transcription factor [Anaerolineae bacterium]
MGEEWFQARILIVEDEPTTLAALTRALSLKGYLADGVPTGQEALIRLNAAPYDVMILDLRLPDIHGVEVLERARQLHPDLLVIILTAYASLESAIAAVKAGTVDYLLKPYSIHALEEAIAKALYRRREQMRREHLLRVIAEAAEQLQEEEPAPKIPIVAPGRFLRAGPVVLDRERRLATVSGPAGEEKSAQLTVNESALLSYFMEHPDTAFSCQELAREVLGYTGLTEQEADTLVRPLVFRLRKKIEPDPDAPTLIRTLRGKGYFFSVT